MDKSSTFDPNVTDKLGPSFRATDSNVSPFSYKNNKLQQDQQNFTSDNGNKSYNFSVVNSNSNSINNEIKPEDLPQNKKFQDIIPYAYEFRDLQEEVQNSDISNTSNKSVEDPSISPKDLPLAKLTFVMFGVAGVLNWSVLLNCILSVFTIIYEYPQGVDTVLLGYFLLSVIAGVLRVRARNISATIVHSGMIILVFTNILLPLTVHFIEGLTGIIMLHLIGSVIGLAVSFIVANGLAYSCIIPVNLTGYVVAGNGLAGLMAFIIWQILTEFFFDIYSKSQLRVAVWVLFSFCLICIVVQAVLFSYMREKEWFKHSLNSFNSTSIQKSSQSLSPIVAENTIIEKENIKINLGGLNSQCRPLKLLILKSLPSLLLSSISFFISYSLFPNIGPYDWVGASLKDSSILVGIYQSFDFIGRYIPNIHKFFQLSRKSLFITVLLRTLFYPIFIVLALYEHKVTTNFILQILLITIFALSNGVVGTQALSDVPRNVKTTAEKGTVGMVMHLFTQIAISCSLVFSKILKLILKIHFH